MFISALVLISLQSVAADSVAPSRVVLKDSLREDVVVQHVRASEQTPVTQSNISEKEIKGKYFGQDIGFMLQYSPGIVGRSDAGIGQGYTDFRLRGLDNTRINFNVNGVPINDPENQGFFTNNFADLTTSAKYIQVQRGVGTTSNGTAPFAGSVNIVTKDAFAPSGFNVATNYGSFNTHRISAECNTGLLNKNFGAYVRLSSLGSDGYRQGAWSDLKTYFASVGAIGKKYFIKFNTWGGITRTGLAYLPISKDSLQKNRRYNPLTPNETDEFQQSFYQLQFAYNILSNFTFSASAYYVKGLAPRFAVLFPATSFTYANMVPYTTSPSGTDTIRSADFMMNYHLNQDLLGAMAFLNYSTDKFSVSGGVHGNHFKADHYMSVWYASLFPSSYTSGHLVYFNTGYKSEFSTFAKINYLAENKLFLFFDLQLRNARFTYVPNAAVNPYDTFRVEPMQWMFFNPRVGGRYYMSDQWNSYLSVGMVSREPTRFDYLQDDRANYHVKKDAIKPESVLDVEAGVTFKSAKVKWEANVYWMEFSNEIASTGEINNFGYLRRVNVSSSFRSGFEMSYEWRPLLWFALQGHGAFSYNKIRAYTQRFLVDSAGVPLSKTINFTDVDPLLTPNLVVNQAFMFYPMQGLSLELHSRYVSKSYLDNTQNEAMVVPEYWVFDVKSQMNLKSLFKSVEPTLLIQVNNVTNTLYSPMGLPGTPWVPGTYFVRNISGQDTPVYNPLYFPAAPIHFIVGFGLKF